MHRQLERWLEMARDVAICEPTLEDQSPTLQSQCKSTISPLCWNDEASSQDDCIVTDDSTPTLALLAADGVARVLSSVFAISLQLSSEVSEHGYLYTSEIIG